jgi:hypothetical protein
MKSPFPGMDPFIEARGLWTDFHDSLIVELRRALNAQLPSRYEALVEERTYIDVVEPIEGSRSQHLVRPDVRIDSHAATQPDLRPEGSGQTALIEPIVMHPELNVEETETYVEVRDSAGGDRVVTCIEVLSPANKRPGSPGWGEYERKRQLMFRGAANFVEIDLLREGKRRAMRESWPQCPYYVLVLRQTEAPKCNVFPAFAVTPLPAFPVPLSPPDADLLLELQPIVDSVIAASRYERRLRYGEPIEPPLSTAENGVLDRVAKPS